ncbi:MAG: hypothetical protein LQ349_003953 [Xanthoria aureola]|nr:MAG: hypothetical protein LQ349_003953 [Xanthoria aureola]
MSAATCTLAVVMFRTLGRVDIPGGLPHSDAVRDKATYREIYHAARTMEEQCVEQGTHPANVGWAVVGAKRSVGVFLWATDSTTNYHVPMGPFLATLTANGSGVRTAEE